MALHEVLGKGLGTFSCAAALVGPKCAAPARNSSTTPAARGLRTDHGQGHLFAFSEIGQALTSVMAMLVRRGSRAVPPLPGATNTLMGLGRLGQLPGQSVFTATRADDKNFHSGSISSIRRCDRPPGRRPGLPAHPAISASGQHHRRSARWGCRHAWSLQPTRPTAPRLPRHF